MSTKKKSKTEKNKSPRKRKKTYARCFFCRQPIEKKSDTYSFKNGLFKNKFFHKDKCSIEAVKCAGCRKEVNLDDVVNIKNGPHRDYYAHAECVCFSCKEPIHKKSESCSIKNNLFKGKRFHKKDNLRLKVLECIECKKELKLREKEFEIKRDCHRRAIECVECKKRFKPNDKLVRVNNGPWTGFYEHEECGGNTIEEEVVDFPNVSWQDHINKSGDVLASIIGIEPNIVSLEKEVKKALKANAKSEDLEKAEKKFFRLVVIHSRLELTNEKLNVKAGKGVKTNYNPRIYLEPSFINLSWVQKFLKQNIENNPNQHKSKRFQENLFAVLGPKLPRPYIRPVENPKLSKYISLQKEYWSKKKSTFKEIEKELIIKKIIYKGGYIPKALQQQLNRLGVWTRKAKPKKK